MSIEVINLTKIYDGQKAVNNISFSAKKGEIVGFLGPNGAGKSTTMKIITGFMVPEQGTVNVCQISVLEHPKETKAKIGYLPESNPLYLDMYAREYLAFVAGVYKVPHKKDRIEEVITLTGLMPESRKRIGQLSKGYKQRVGLAAALIHDPEVLVLDEPTTGLDPNQIIEIRDLIKGLGRNKTILFSTHILQEVEAICDRAIIINKGSLVADDSVQNLQKRNPNSQILLVQFKEEVDMASLIKLRDVQHVEESPKAGSGTGGIYKIDSSNPESVRKQLMEMALQNNWNIVSLQSENRSLEEVFRSLTNEKSR